MAHRRRCWRHEIWTGACEVLVSNVRFLAAYRNPARLDAGIVSAVAARVDELARMCEIAGMVEPGDRARAAVLHLLWRGVLRADLSAPLSAETMLEPAA